ncbi:MAG: hypothetical protein WAT74_17185, partial [Flavobacteriales bacterium]
YEQYTPDGVIGVTGARRVVYPSVYDSIDVHLYSNRWGPKMYIVVRPGGNPEHIKILWEGHDSLKIDLQGHLDVWFKHKFIKLTQGLAYQQVNSDIVEIPWTANYVIDNGQLQTGFAFGGYDTSLPLILIVRPFNPDPSLLGGGGGPVPPEWCTFLAGAHDDRMLDITHDSEGYIYLTGSSSSVSGLPIFPGVAAQPAMAGAGDAIIGRFNEFYEIDDGAGWMTYFGGATADKGAAIAYDRINNRVAITGSTFSGIDPPAFPFAGNPNSWSTIAQGAPAQFIAWFDAAEGVLLYFTRTKGELNTDYDGDIAVDAAGNTYVVGRALVLDALSEGPVNPPGAYVQLNNPVNPNLLTSGTGFVLRLDPQANLTWFTPLGGPQTEFVNA